MDREDIYKLLDTKNINYIKVDHEAVYKMNDLDKLNLPFKNDAKNLFLKDDKEKNFYLITLKENKSLDIKNFRKTYLTRKLSFASEQDLYNILGLKKGSVTPFGLFNDNNRIVQYFIDIDFVNDNKPIGVHPNDNTATIFLNVNDLIQLITEHGNIVTYLKQAYNK